MGWVAVVGGIHSRVPSIYHSALWARLGPSSRSPRDLSLLFVSDGWPMPSPQTWQASFSEGWAPLINETG